jgi:agmatinase
MYNTLQEIPEMQKLVQVGVRDFSESEWQFINKNSSRVVTYFDRDIRRRQFEGDGWKQMAEEIVNQLPEKVYISFDIDGLDPKLCPNTGTPVMGGFETEQVFYLFSKVIQSGRKLVGFDLNEVGVGEGDWDANVGARILFKLCNLLVASNS